jgi:hypothetical protein
VNPPPPPAWTDFSIMMECTPESGRCHSVYSVELQTINNITWRARFDRAKTIFRILSLPLVGRERDGRERDEGLRCGYGLKPFSRPTEEDPDSQPPPEGPGSGVRAECPLSDGEGGGGVNANVLC